MHHNEKRQDHELDRKRHREEQKQQDRDAAKQPRPVWPALLLGAGFLVLAVVIVAAILLA